MTKETELSTIDLRYEGYRLKNPTLEGRLLASIALRGIEEPLECVDTDQSRILLNGFKRYRCAKKLGLETAPYKTLGEDEASAIITMLRSSNNKSLNILEQARFIDDLHQLHNLSPADIADLLSRSKSWVSMRLGLIKRLSPGMRKHIFSGDFPIYSYMYTLRPFMRMNGEGKRDVEKFVEAVSGKKLSIREIEQLAHGYFRGPDHFRQEILEGKLPLVLSHIKDVPENPDGVGSFERVFLKDLCILQKYMGRIKSKIQDRRLKSRTFHAQANLLTSGLLSQLPGLTQALKELYDRSGNT